MRTNLAEANSYYRVTKAFDILERVGWTPSNEWYGATQMCRPNYRPLRVKRGGVLLNLIGGLFYADKPGAPCRPVALKASTKSAFEKTYGGGELQVWPLDKLVAIAPVPYVHVG